VQGLNELLGQYGLEFVPDDRPEDAAPEQLSPVTDKKVVDYPSTTDACSPPRASSPP
jgi:hypothetical protein